MMRLKIIPMLLAVMAFMAASCSSAEKEEVDSGKIIIGHVTDSHTWHILDYKSSDGTEHPVAINLPIILIDDGHLEVFSSKQFHHGHAIYKGKKHSYALVGGGLEKEEIVCVAEDGAEVASEDAAEVSSEVATEVSSEVTAEGEPQTIVVGEKVYTLLTDGEGKVLKPVDISITKTAAAIMIAVALLIVIVIASARKYKVRGVTTAPHGMQSLVELLVLHVRDGIVAPILGHNTNRFLPYLLTLFFFIFFCNILGLIPIFPAGANITGNIAVTAILALITFFITNLKGNKHYWKDIFNTPGVPAWLKIFPLMPLVELVGVFTKPIVLMIRLFANMTAGHIVILGFVVIIFILSNSLGMAVGGAVSVVSVVFAVFISLLECLVAYIQAFVFTMLSALYISMAVEEPEEA
ncbi:MAG: F0F1 ATP synthase subunit A [Bacteroidales bacterium]|nr:F0F1 ATP synthase subunit A [Bacteroidales bacterium]